MRFVFTFLMLMILAAPVMAASSDGPPVSAAPVGRVDTDALAERLTGNMRALTPLTLRYNNATILLWGLRPAGAPGSLTEAKALELMDALVQDQQMTCRVVSGASNRYIARCGTQEVQDLGVELIGAGYAFADRAQTDGTVFASVYEKAQETARVQKNGIWLLEDVQKSALPAWLQPYLSVLLPLGLIFGPLGGLLVVAFVMRHWLKNMADQQAHESARNAQKEERLMNRERQVLITTLEAELIENKNKIEAFMAIYGDMLSDMKGSSRPRYMDSGDIVQKLPAYSKTLCESNVSKLSLLDMKLAGQLSNFYVTMSKDNEYINLEPDLPVETAVKLIEKVMQDTNELLPELDATIAQLESAMADN